MIIKAAPKRVIFPADSILLGDENNFNLEDFNLAVIQGPKLEKLSIVGVKLLMMDYEINRHKEKI